MEYVKEKMQQQKTSAQYYQNLNQNTDTLFDRKVDLVTAGLQQHNNNYLRDESQVSRENALAICNYILAMKTEINLSDNYRGVTIRLIVRLSKFTLQKPFNLITRDEILAFLDSLRKPEASDPLHKWVGSYNTYNIQLTRFFKWLYAPDIESDKRRKPKVVENIPRLKRKEKSIYKPDDLGLTFGIHPLLVNLLL